MLKPITRRHLQPINSVGCPSPYLPNHYVLPQYPIPPLIVFPSVHPWHEDAKMLKDIIPYLATTHNSITLETSNSLTTKIPMAEAGISILLILNTLRIHFNPYQIYLLIIGTILLTIITLRVTINC